jgi:putative Ca2+/H+ antiporter (TMEM165/GDT1 family)
LSLAHFLLRANYFLIFGSWTIIPDRNQDIQAVLKVAVATTLSTTRFAFMLEMVAEMANSAPGEYEEFCKREF